MTEFKTFRDAEASLWQSAVDEAVARREGGAVGAALPAPGTPIPLPQQAHPFARAAAFAGGLIAGLKALPAGLPAAEALGTLQGLAGLDPVHLGVVFAVLARRFAGQEGQFREALRGVQFSNLDPLWLEAGYNYYRYLQGRREAVPYRPYNRLDDYVIPKPLPERARVALVSDWGTGTDGAIHVLQEIAARDPDVVIHLGDIYYAGTEAEVRDRFWTPWSAHLDLSRVSTFTLAGNHDMYSGGKPYYELIDRLGQPSSYFSLRNEHWQLVAMDTGRNSGLRHDEPTFLQDTEVAWVRDKVENAGGRGTILLSHHSLFSAYETVGQDQDGVNHLMLRQFEAILSAPGGIKRWFWGHEHRLAVYRDYHNVTARCIGHGAIPVSDAQLPRRQDGVDIPVDEGISLGKSDYFYNHGYVILDLDGPAATARYYQVPGPPEEVYEESF